MESDLGIPVDGNGQVLFPWQQDSHLALDVSATHAYLTRHWIFDFSRATGCLARKRKTCVPAALARGDLEEESFWLMLSLLGCETFIYLLSIFPASSSWLFFSPRKHMWQGWVSPRVSATVACTENKVSCAIRCSRELRGSSSWGSRVAFEGSCRQGAKGEVEGGHVLLPVLLVCDLSPVLGTVAWGQQQGDASLTAGCSPRQHPMPPAAPAKAAKILILPLGSLLSRFSARSAQVVFKALNEKKGKHLIAKGLLMPVLSDQPCTHCRTSYTQQGLTQPQPLQVARCWRKGVKMNLFLIALGMHIFC